MGRDRDLPAIFGRIHPRNKTPHWAIWLSGLLIILMAVWLPVADVASGASITFLLLFLMVNVALIRMRKTRPDLPRPFRVPLVPWIPMLSIAIMLVLAIELFELSPIAWVATSLWLLLGLLVYSQHGAADEAAKLEDTILLEQTVASREYSVLLPVANEATARRLADLATLFAMPHDGELFALNVISVPRQIGVSDGRAFLRQSRPILEEVISVGQEHDIPVRTMLRLGRDVGDSIISAARARKADLMLLGWPGYTYSKGQAFGTIIDLMSKNPPCDLAVVHLRKSGLPGRILVPVAGGPNTRLALELALTEAEAIEQRTGTLPEVIALNIMPNGSDGNKLEQRRLDLLRDLGIDGWPIELRIVASDDVGQAILDEASEFEQIIIGASEEGLLEQSLFGSIPQRVAEEALSTVIMAKRHDPVKYGVRQWLIRRTRKGRQI